jgi:hypothetical protein
MVRAEKPTQEQSFWTEEHTWSLSLGVSPDNTHLLWGNATLVFRQDQGDHVFRHWGEGTAGFSDNFYRNAQANAIGM